MGRRDLSFVRDARRGDRGTPCDRPTGASGRAHTADIDFPILTSRARDAKQVAWTRWTEGAHPPEPGTGLSARSIIDGAAYDFETGRPLKPPCAQERLHARFRAKSDKPAHRQDGGQR